jgi:hypothetical protein
MEPLASSEPERRREMAMVEAKDRRCDDRRQHPLSAFPFMPSSHFSFAQISLRLKTKTAMARRRMAVAAKLRAGMRRSPIRPCRAWGAR